MQFLQILFYWLCWFSIASAQAPPISPCALTCLGQQIPLSGCAITDFACQCSSKNLTVNTAACMLENCTMSNTLGLAKFQANICKAPIQDRSHIIVSVFIGIVAVSAVMIFLRFVNGSLKGNKVGLEDWSSLAALLLAVVPIALTFKMAKGGFGKHLYSLSEGELLIFLRNFYIAENVYVAVLATIKISILLFYLRIFEHQLIFRNCVYATILFVSISSSLIILLTIFSCQPIAYFWNRDLPNGVCLDVNALAYANSALSMVQDIIITLLPVRVVWGLNMSTHKKMEVAGMFALGGFGCIVSAIRLKVLLGFGNSIDPTWDYLFVVIWTAIELGVAIVLSCLPAVRLLIIRIRTSLPNSNLRSDNRKMSEEFDAGSEKDRWGSKRNNDFQELGEVDESLTRISQDALDSKFPRKLSVPSKYGLPEKF